MPLSWTSLLASFHSIDHVFTGKHESDRLKQSWLGQIHQSPRLSSAYIHYLLPPESGDLEGLIPLLEGLTLEAVGWGAKQVIANILPDSDIFLHMRRAGFSVLAKHRMFKFKSLNSPMTQLRGKWRIWTSEDIHDMRILYAALVPPLIQPIEPLTRLEMLGMVYDDGSGEIQAFADLVYGPAGVWVLPFVNPQTVEDTSDLLANLLSALPDVAGRPVVVTARSYQPWIENALSSLPGEAGLEQTLMVRYLALRQRVTQDLPFAALENGKPEPMAPLAPIQKQQG